MPQQNKHIIPELKRRIDDPDVSAEEVYKFFQEEIPKDLHIKFLDMIIHYMIKSNQPDIVEQILRDFTVPQSSNLQILLIEHYLKLDKPDQAREIFNTAWVNGTARKKMYTLIQEYASSHYQWRQYMKFFKEYLEPMVHRGLWQLETTDIHITWYGKVLSMEMMFFIQQRSTVQIDLNKAKELGLHVYLRPEGLRKCFNTQEDREKWARDIGKLDTDPKIMDHQYEYVIDGANIMYYDHREIVPESYVQLNAIIDLLSNDVDNSKKILLVLHQRHFKLRKYDKDWTLGEITLIEGILNRWDELPQLVICKTPYHVNDDLYSIYYASHCNSLMVTNDLFRDHIWKANSNDNTNIQPEFYQWHKENAVNYTIKRKPAKCSISSWRPEINLIMPLEYSHCFQLDENENRYGTGRQRYIPTTDPELWIVHSP